MENDNVLWRADLIRTQGGLDGWLNGGDNGEAEREVGVSGLDIW